MEIPLFLVCDFANVDSDSKLNMLGVFHKIYSYEFPTTYERMYIVAKIIIDENDGFSQETKAHVALTGHDGEELMRVPLAFAEVPKKDRAATNVVVSISNLKLPKSGKHEFLLFIDGRLRKSFFVDVVQLEGELT